MSLTFFNQRRRLMAALRALKEAEAKSAEVSQPASEAPESPVEAASEEPAKKSGRRKKEV